MTARWTLEKNYINASYGLYTGYIRAKEGLERG